MERLIIMTAYYLVIEGIEGVGKSTQVNELTKHLEEKGYRVLQTKEPGTPLIPITMELRNLMLNNGYNESLTPQARELISQAIRSIHLDKLVIPALDKYDFIVQDRGILSGLAYGEACGHDVEDLAYLANYITHDVKPHKLYDHVIYLKGDVKAGLQTAKNAKQEFEDGDAIELMGVDFMQRVSSNMDGFIELFDAHKTVIDVTGKSIQEVTAEILGSIKL